MRTLKLQAREIVAALPGQTHLAGRAEPTHERFPWLDSSLDLERGLDVLELSVDVLLPDLQGPPHAAR
ncbi:MAG: hypothetical protein V4792_08330 [Pseudomonadota bacterium]